MRFLIAAALCLGLASCQTAKPEPPFTLTDLTGAYARFYDATQGLPEAERIAAFKHDVAPAYPSFYNAERYVSMGVPAERFDQQIGKSFTEFPAIRAKYANVSANFAAMLEPARASFVRAFPDLGSIGQITLLHSLGEMDGGTREIDGQTRLIFGADVIARVHDFNDEQPFFHHELFHVYHGRYFGDCDQVWCGLWQEGLAVYVAASLNPGASDSQLLLTTPEPLRSFVEAHPEAICATIARLDSTDGSVFFMGNHHLDGMPARIGYAVGYLAAREVGRTHTLQQLAHMNQTDARPVLEAALRTLAACPVEANCREAARLVSAGACHTIRSATCSASPLGAKATGPRLAAWSTAARLASS